MLKNRTKFKTDSSHRFYSVTRNVVGKEVKQGDTITFISEVNLKEINDLRESYPPKERPSYTTFVVKAASLAMLEFPYTNRRLYSWPLLSFWGSRMQTFKNIDITVACERDEPEAEVAAFFDVIRDADRLSLLDINSWLKDLANCDTTTNKQWKGYKLLVTKLPSWLSSFIIGLPIYFPSLWSEWRGGSLVISSPAKYGVDIMVGSWPSPLGVSFGLVKDRPIAIDGRVEICPTFQFTLNWDRRIMAGAQAAKFFKRIIDILEKPNREMNSFL